MKTEKQLITENQQWVQKLLSISEKYEVLIYKRIIAFVNYYQDNANMTEKQLRQLLNDLEKEILDLIYEALEATYSITLKYIKKMYDIVSDKRIDFKDLTYQKDGLTLEERIHGHVKSLYDFLLEKIQTHKGANLAELIRMIFSPIVKVLDTEVFTVGNNLMHMKLIGYCTVAMLITEGDICCQNDGIVLIDDFIPPPYHPNCRCTAIYLDEETDNIDDISDLDLEIEEIIV